MKLPASSPLRRLLDVMSEPLFELSPTNELVASCTVLGLADLLALAVESCPGAALPALTSALDCSALVLENAMAALQLSQHKEVQEAFIR
jgi:hypothetical protein